MGEFAFILTAAGAGLAQVFTGDIFPMMLVGIFVGMFLGLVPGLGGLVGFALLIPFSLSMEPLVGIAFLLAMSAVTTQTDTIPAVILGVPGTAAAMATSLDGYPLAKKGQAGRALCASYYASIFGTLVATALFLLFLPILRAVIFAFGQPEFFMLVMLGLILAGSLAGNSLARGLIMAGFGLLLSTVTLETSTGEPRFAGDILYLWEGVPLLPVILGIFAIPEVVDLARRKISISATAYDTRVSGLWWGLKDCIENWWLIIKAGTLGTVAGFIPGLGGQFAEWLAYGSAVASDKDPSTFGKGNIRGVIAPAAGTAAQKPGALIPTLTFGIPGNGGMAIVLGVFLILGLRPGPEMVTTKLDSTMMMVWVIVVANVVAAILALLLQKWLVLLCYLRSSVIVPLVIGTMMVGATMANQSFGDVILFFIFGVLGYVFKHADWPRVPLIMGLIMGKLAEQYLFLSTNLHGFKWLTDRPIVWVIAVVIVAVVVVPAIKRAWYSNKRQQGVSTRQSTLAEDDK